MSSKCDWCGKSFRTFSRKVTHLRFCPVKRIEDDKITDQLGVPRSDRPTEGDLDFSQLKGISPPWTKEWQEQFDKNHNQLDAFMRGETDELPDVLKPKGEPVEIPPEQDVSNIEPFKSMLGLAWKSKDNKKRKKKV